MKIVPENAAAIEAELAKANGRASSHTVTSFAEVADEAYRAERKLEALGIPKSKRAGATFRVQSGGKVAKAYRRARRVTVLTMIRRASGWYLGELYSTEVYPDESGYGRLKLTAEQDAAAVALVRKAYEVQK